MSLPSLNSLGTTYGSCLGSDGDSVQSQQTYRSARSGSTLFMSGESDTDTLMDDESSSSADGNFYDVVDVNTDDDNININDEHSVTPLAEDLDDDESQNLITTLSALDFRSSTPVPLTGCSPTSSERSRLLGNQSRHSGNQSRHSGDLSERARLLGDSGDHSNGSSSINSSVQTVAENPGPSGSSLSQYQPIITRIPTGRSSLCQPPTQSTSRFAKWIVPLYLIFLFSCNVGFQTCLRFNSNLNSWTLTFWRSILQLIIGLLGLCVTSQSLIGPPGSRFKLLCHAVLSGVTVFAMLYSSERLIAKDLAAIFLCLPVGPMILELALRRGSLRVHFSVFVMLVWLWAVVLLSRNIPWPAFALSNETNSTSEDSEWQPPIFGLDNIQLWPVQPSIFSREKNETGNEGIFFDESQKVSGLIVGIVGLATSSILPVIATSCPSTLLWPILVWQSVGACVTATTGLLLHGQSFIFVTPMDWMFASIIAVLGLLGNILMLQVLTLKLDKSRNGWSDQTRFTSAVTLGVVARSALEIVLICGINYLTFNGEPVSIEDGLGIALLLATGLFCCFVKPIGHDLILPNQSSSPTSCVIP